MNVKTDIKSLVGSQKQKVKAGFKRALLTGMLILAFYLLTIGVTLLIAFSYYGKGFTDKLTNDYLAFVDGAVIILLLYLLVYTYFRVITKGYFDSYKNICLVYTIFIVSLAMSVFVGRFVNTPLARPVALFALLSLTLVGRRSTIFLTTVFSLLSFAIDFSLGISGSNIYVIGALLLISFLAGELAIFVVGEESTRLSVIIRGFVIYVPIAVTGMFTKLLNTQWTLSMYEVFIYGLVGALGSVILFTVLLPIFEKVFNEVTNYRLNELCNHESKLVKLLKQKAPGTFNHSITVAHLAEACAIDLDENPVLARAAAYYHDMGKMRQAEFFSENQTGKNPHDELAPELSLDIIRSHTKDGYDLIRAYRLPQILADVALQHHGTMPIRYFYAKALMMTDGEVDVAQYSYFGPIPQTKTAAIIMLCDACEAVSRTLSARDVATVEKAVRKVIEERMNSGQLNDCTLTLKDLNIIRGAIVACITGIRHSRIKYPIIKSKMAEYENDNTEVAVVESENGEVIEDKNEQMDINDLL